MDLNLFQPDPQNGVIPLNQRIKYAAQGINPPIIPQIDDPYANAPQIPSGTDLSQVPGYVPDSSEDIDPIVQERQRNSALRNRIAQGVWGSNDPNAPPLPQEYQNKIDQIKSAIAPGPVEKNYMEQVNAAYNAPKVHGLKARLAGLGKGLLMGEGIAGMVRGAGDPSNMNLRYRLAQLQPLAQGAQLEQQFKQTALARNKELAETSGIDPFTGLTTPRYDYWSALGGAARQRAQTGQQRADDYGNWLDSRIADLSNKPVLEQRKEVTRLLNSGNLRTPESLAWAAHMLEIPVALQPKFLSGQIKVDENFNYVDVTTGEKFMSNGQPITSVQKPIEEKKTQRANILAGGRTTPEERSQDRAIRQGHLTVAQQNEQRMAEASAHKQAESENPLPPFASQEQIDARNKKVQDRVTQILQSKTPAPTTAAPPSAPAQKGEKIIRRQQSASTGEVFLTIQMPDGSTYVRKQ